MPDVPEENGPSAGISSAEEVDVAALFARLQDEVRRGGSASSGDDRVRLAARDQAERVWAVSAERRELGGRSGFVGALLKPVKLVLRRLMRWYVEPLAADQRAFNDAVLKLLDDLGERVDRLEERASAGSEPGPDG
jgi:hypothetical protein